MVSKREALYNYIINILEAHEPGWKGAQFMREATFKSASRDSRIKVMGSPTKYVEVVWRGTSPDVESAFGGTHTEGDSFQVNVWYGFKDSDEYEFSSQSRWDEMMRDEEGLLTQLLKDGYMLVDGKPSMFEDLSNIQITEVSLDREGKELAHFASFMITLT